MGDVGAWPWSKLFIFAVYAVGTDGRAAPRWCALPGEDVEARRRCSGCATTAGGEFANVVEEDGALEFVELRGVHGDLGEEGVSHEDRRLVAMTRVGVSQEGGDVDLKGTGEAIERGQGRHGLAVLDFGDVSAGDAHASGELALREIAHMAQIANSCGYLQATFYRYGCGD